MASPLDNLTDAIGLPKGFLDALYPFSLYQTNPPNLDALNRSSGMGPPSIAPNPLGSPNPLSQQIPPPPGMGQLMGQIQQGMQPPSVPPGMGMPQPGLAGLGPMSPPSANPAPQLGAGNPIWPWLMRQQNPMMPIPMMLRRLGMSGFTPPGPGLNVPPQGTQGLPMPPRFHRPRGGGNNNR